MVFFPGFVATWEEHAAAPPGSTLPGVLGLLADFWGVHPGCCLSVSGRAGAQLSLFLLPFYRLVPSLAISEFIGFLLTSTKGNDEAI